MSIKETGKFLSNPLSVQQYQLNEQYKKEHKNKWKHLAIGYFVGLTTALAPAMLTYYLQSSQRQIDAGKLLEVARLQKETTLLIKDLQTSFLSTQTKDTLSKNLK